MTPEVEDFFPRTPNPCFLKTNPVQSRTHNALFCPRLPVAAQWPQCHHTIHIVRYSLCLPLCRFSSATSNGRATNNNYYSSSSISRLSPPGPCETTQARDETAQTKLKYNTTHLIHICNTLLSLGATRTACAAQIERDYQSPLYAIL